MSLEHGFDEAVEEKVTDLEEKKKKTLPFTHWIVGGESYKLKLKTETICKLEGQFKKNLSEIITEGGVPALSVMLTVTQAALVNWHHGISFEKVQKLFDMYLEEGGDQDTFYMDIFVPMLLASGFFAKKKRGLLEKAIEEMRTELAEDETDQ